MHSIVLHSNSKTDMLTWNIPARANINLKEEGNVNKAFYMADKFLCHNENTLWDRCFTTQTSLALHLFLLSWLKLNLIL